MTPGKRQEIETSVNAVIKKWKDRDINTLNIMKTLEYYVKGIEGEQKEGQQRERNEAYEALLAVVVFPKLENAEENQFLVACIRAEIAALGMNESTQVLIAKQQQEGAKKQKEAEEAKIQAAMKAKFDTALAKYAEGQKLIDDEAREAAEHEQGGVEYYGYNKYTYKSSGKAQRGEEIQREPISVISDLAKQEYAPAKEWFNKKYPAPTNDCRIC